MWVSETPSGESRASLARRATEIARAAMPGVDVEILWDGMWVRRVGPDYFPDPDMFRLQPASRARLGALGADRRGKHLRDAEDYWFHLYKPRRGRCDRGYRRRPRRGCIRIFARGGAGRARLGHRAASGFICSAGPVVRTQPAGECHAR